ncbi:hypothetical protein [Paenibacillus sp. 453mf]|uniref:hypothetical protein n=1 Tax=Paenibacillus sp. 453mf TaxID=1761874 RepID=UPI0011142B5C|nr:hypothetical protein [Paenibacillus sp. 453mf]
MHRVVRCPGDITHGNAAETAAHQYYRAQARSAEDGSIISGPQVTTQFIPGRHCPVWLQRNACAIDAVEQHSARFLPGQ